MPSRSAKQARTMAAAAHSPEFAAKMNIPQGVAREFNRADAGTSKLHQAVMEREASRRQHQKMQQARHKK